MLGILKNHLTILKKKGFFFNLNRMGWESINWLDVTQVHTCYKGKQLQNHLLPLRLNIQVCSIHFIWESFAKGEHVRLVKSSIIYFQKAHFHNFGGQNINITQLLKHTGQIKGLSYQYPPPPHKVFFWGVYKNHHVRLSVHVPCECNSP